MFSDTDYGFNVGDIIYMPYMSDVPVSLYEVTAINPLWISNDAEGSFNSQYYDLGGIKLICKNWDRADT